MMKRLSILSALLPLLAGLSSLAAGTIDVVSLGAKNDGSEDVSAIVNANTARGPLFFPAGIYKVSHPLVLKNSIRGEGYSRSDRVDASRTWLVSDIVCTNGAVGIVEFEGARPVNLENLNIKCNSRECGIRLGGHRLVPFTHIDKVGIFNVASWGLFVKGQGSRNVFVDTATIWGTKSDPMSRARGIRIEGVCDCRLSNIEIMSVCTGLELLNPHTYGDNIHIWTGIEGKREGGWWRDTRGIVLGETAHFSGSGIYVDTCYHAFDMRGEGSLCEIANFVFWEDGSAGKDLFVKEGRDRTGSFMRGGGKLVVNGGMIGVAGKDGRLGAMTRFYSPSAVFRDVILKSEHAVKGENMDRLCLGRELPDYTVRYADKGWCKVADVFTVANTGVCAATLTLGGGAAWRIGVLKGESGKVEFAAKPLNPLCGAREIRMVEEDGVAKVFVRCEDASPIEARFTTTYMTERLRPLDHASLRDRQGNPRYRDVRESLVCRAAGAVRPVPSKALKARIAEGVDLIGIVHWGPNTFTDREWGYGDEDPALLNPSRFNADQIAGACRDGGLKGLVVVAKHHDGFCLWPTKTTEHNITKTPFWRGTGRDYVKEMELACRKAGLKFGVYISPWDRNSAYYATERYVDIYHAQIKELLGGEYGEIFEVWFDGANGGDGYYGGAREKRKIDGEYYRFDEVSRFVRELQPSVTVFEGCRDSEFRWPGNERGFLDSGSRATTKRWGPEYRAQRNTGSPDGQRFRMCEADFPLRKGWFYHESERGTTKRAAYLAQRYIGTAGNGGTMNIGIAPNKDGLLDEDDVRELKAFKRIVDALFANRAKDGEPFNIVEMREDLANGEQVDGWRIVADGREILSGTAIGSRRIRILPEPVAAKDVKLEITADGGNARPVALLLYSADPQLVRSVIGAAGDGGETETAKMMAVTEVNNTSTEGGQKHGQIRK